MIKVIASRDVEMSKDEWVYYQSIEKAFGDKALIGMFETNKYGLITIITPPTGKPTSMILLFFLLNLQLNQRLRKLSDGFSSVKDLEKRIKNLEEKAKES